MDKFKGREGEGEGEEEKKKRERLTNKTMKENNAEGRGEARGARIRKRYRGQTKRVIKFLNLVKVG